MHTSNSVFALSDLRKMLLQFRSGLSKNNGKRGRGNKSLNYSFLQCSPSSALEIEAASEFEVKDEDEDLFSANLNIVSQVLYCSSINLNFL